MSFTIDTEQSNKISFLDIIVICEQGKFTTSIENQLLVVYTLIFIVLYQTPTKLVWFTH